MGGDLPGIGGPRTRPYGGGKRIGNTITYAHDATIALTTYLQEARYVIGTLDLS